MLPVLFTLTIPPSLGLVVWLAVSAASGAWQLRSAKAAGEKNLLKTFATWTAGTAVVLFAAGEGPRGADNPPPGPPPADPGATLRHPGAARLFVAASGGARGAAGR